jgi:molecular chaperone GrpE
MAKKEEKLPEEKNPTPPEDVTKEAQPAAEAVPEASDSAEAAPETFTVTKEQMEKMEALAAQLAAEQDKYLRLAAEYDNYRRRSQKEKENVYSDGKADTVLQLLPVYDNLARALKAECSDPNFYKGVEMTMTQLLGIFEKLGVKPIEAEGQPFDPAEHNAVVHVEDEALGENLVVEEFQKGFKLNDKVIRFAMVKVAN